MMKINLVNCWSELHLTAQTFICLNIYRARCERLSRKKPKNQGHHFPFFSCVRPHEGCGCQFCPLLMLFFVYWANEDVRSLEGLRLTEAEYIISSLALFQLNGVAPGEWCGFGALGASGASFALCGRYFEWYILKAKKFAEPLFSQKKLRKSA